MPSLNPGSPGQDDSSGQDDSPHQPTGAQEQAAKFFLASIVESSQDSIVTIDFDGIITTWNKAAERVYGYRADEALGKPLTMLTLAEDLTGILNKIETVQQSRKVEIFDTVRVRKDGREIHLEIMMSPVKDDAGAVIGISTVARDVTVSRQAAEALRQSEEQFRRAIEDAPIPVIMHAEDGQVLQISRTWTQLTGYTRQDVPTLDAWLGHAYGEGADVVRDHMHELFNGTQKTLSVDFAIRTRHEMDRYWSFSASSPGTLRDGRRFIVAMAVDITERRRAEESLRESEERFRLLVEGTRDYAMFLMDAQRRIVHWSRGAERIFGWTRDEAIGQMADMIFVPEDIAAGAPEQESQTAVRNGSAADIRWHLRKNGSRFWADGVNTSLKDENGRVRGFAKITRDATREKEDEEALHQAHEALQQAHDELEQRVLERTAALRGEMKERRKSEQAREQLLQRIVKVQEKERQRISRELHDQMGQQLTALVVGLKALSALVDLQPASSSQQVEYLQNLSEELMQQMHQLAWELRPSVLDNFGLEPALEQYVQEWSHQSGIKADFVTRGLEKKMRVNPDIETALYRVVQEALTNVQRHSGAQAVSVVLERRGSQLVAIVEDDGQGFKISRSKGRASKTSGKGQARLGLLGMQERMELIKGTLEIESTPGQGTTVYARVSIK